MDAALLLAVAGMVSAWTVAGYAIWKWGPGVRRRSVECPTQHAGARVLAVQQEGAFGCLRTVDVRRCSLIQGDEITCGKECLARL